MMGPDGSMNNVLGEAKIMDGRTRLSLVYDGRTGSFDEFRNYIVNLENSELVYGEMDFRLILGSNAQFIPNRVALSRESSVVAKYVVEETVKRYREELMGGELKITEII
jgi:hypothetical protein